MKILVDVFGHKVELSNERWKHIVLEHPEVEEYRGKIEEVLQSPDVVKESKRDKSVELYYKYYPEILGGKYLLVVAKIKPPCFVVTMYVTDRIKKGVVVWKRN